MGLPPGNAGWGTSAPPLAQPEKSKHLVLKFILLGVAILVTFLMWQCGTALYQGATKSDAIVSHFHELLNNGKYEQICGEADPYFQAAENKQALLKVLLLIHERLGRAGATTRGVVNVNANTNGTFLSVDYQTQFEKGTAKEEFTFRKSVTGDLKLLGYHVQSSALLDK